MGKIKLAHYKSEIRKIYTFFRIIYYTYCDTPGTAEVAEEGGVFTASPDPDEGAEGERVQRKYGILKQHISFTLSTGCCSGSNSI